MNEHVKGRSRSVPGTAARHYWEHRARFRIRIILMSPTTIIFPNDKRQLILAGTNERGCSYSPIGTSRRQTLEKPSNPSYPHLLIWAWTLVSVSKPACKQIVKNADHTDHQYRIWSSY